MVALAKADNIIPIHSILLSSKSNEWYTPSIYVEAARCVMGNIDLDPASCKEANLIVKASRYYSQETNGLDKPWHGCIWLNPPYGTTNNRSNAGIWINKLLEEYRLERVKQAIILVNANPDTHWFHRLFAFPICFTEGRINFYNSTHKVDTAFSRPGKSNHTHGSAFAYLGKNKKQFIEVFSQFGTIVERVSKSKERPVNLSLWEGL